MTVYLDGRQLTLDQIKDVIEEKEKVEIHKAAWTKISRSRQTIETVISRGDVVYGVNTGFGKMSDTLISSKDIGQLQINLIRSHACGVGKPLSEKVSRGMLLLRANALAKGYSGVTHETLQILVDCLNYGIHPVIPSQGSLGASGDLAPLSHLALVLIGEGEAIYKGEKMSGLDALNKCGLKPITLQAKEGLALINGTQAMTAIGVVSYLEAKDLAYFADSIAALTLETLRGITDPFLPDSHQVRPYPEQEDVARRILSFVDDSQLTTRQGDIRVQDAYSLRCIPQVHGAIHRVLGYVEDTLAIEVNAATDNPLVFSDSGHVISGGNFHGEPVAFAMDFLGIALAETANISERRVERLVNPQLNDLPPFLSIDPGLQSGLMITQYVAASLVSENKTLAHPASVDSIPSSANQEDHVSMGTTAARHAHQIIQNTRRVIAIEALCAAQAADVRGSEKLASYTKSIYDFIRSKAPTITEDREFSKDIQNIEKGILQEEWKTYINEGVS
ncbi:histidine ammonia-lyase [Terrilactibacillus laevilacticus]|uniref:Histidine ammonia-lyase n=1 Tax=Terrilactibacillus laevilacticus TaxID=1380157 RepID=A0ABW5PNI5_9BACI|nr:histidine ammonia-lyase [Terrilactibacillus laevilacticus]